MTTDCEHDWVGPGHPALYGCTKCGKLVIVPPGGEAVEASLRRIREDTLGQEACDALYAEAEAIIRGEVPMPAFPVVEVEGLGVLQHESGWVRKA